MHFIGLNNIYRNNLEEFLTRHCMTRHCNTAFMLNIIAILFSAYCRFNIL